MRVAIIALGVSLASAAGGDPPDRALVARSGLVALESVPVGSEIGIGWDTPMADDVHVALGGIGGQAGRIPDRVPVDPMTGIVTLTAPQTPGPYTLTLVRCPPATPCTILAHRPLQVIAPGPAEPETAP